MNYCFNPSCQNPQNHNGIDYCSSCGSKLLLKDRYRALKLLGQGSAGRTFLAIDQDQPCQPQCVIKQYFSVANGEFLVSSQAVGKVKPGYLKMFYQTTKQLDELGKHPALPKLWASFELDGYQYVVKQYIEGGAT